jgi:hypothetical protein
MEKIVNIMFYIIIGILLYFLAKCLSKDSDLTPLYFFGGAIVIYLFIGYLAFL